MYYQPAAVRQQDAFVIICTITSAPAAPAPVPAVPRHPVPKDLLESMGSLLDEQVSPQSFFLFPSLRMRAVLCTPTLSSYCHSEQSRHHEGYTRLAGC